jgi:proton-translocating NADH-quinone oxidoreductase chain L
MSATFYLLLATLLPLIGFLALIFFGRRFAGLAGPFATGLLIISLAASISGLVGWVAKPEFNQGHYVEAVTFRWMPLPGGTWTGPGAGPAEFPERAPAPTRSPAITVGILIDSLTVALFGFVTLIGVLVHLFSIPFMAGDPRLPRYFAYLGLLCFSMLALILSNSLIQLFACWQLVGIAAALLVGFWFERRGPATALLRMMLVNAIGDAALVIGIGILVYHVGAAGLTFYNPAGTSVLSDSLRAALGVDSREFLYLSGAGPQSFLGLHWLTWAGLLMFAGAAAKAAQFPLHVWLPETAEAPAPVAAILQTATMTAAGIFLIARLYPILTMDVRLVMAVIGCTTLLMGALIALVQTDLRRLLAYSTISQLGFIVLFLGAGGYNAGLLHLFTHGFFKAGLLLGAGSVLQALHNESDLRRMGGLWRKLPLTAIAFSLCAMALIGMPFFSGAYSSRYGFAVVYEYAQALAAPTQSHLPMLLFYIPVAAAFLTAFYMARCAWLIFGGKPRNEDLAENAGESFLLVLPLGILAALSINLYEFFGLPRLMIKSLQPYAIGGGAGGGPPVARGYAALEPSLQLLMTREAGYVFWACLAAVPAVLLYWNGLRWAERIRRLPLLNLLYLWLRERMFFDTLYNGVVAGGVLVLSRIANFIDWFVIEGIAGFVILMVHAVSRLAAAVDRLFVDGVVNGIADGVRFAGTLLVIPQAGRLRVYVLITLAGLATLAGLVWAAMIVGR